MRYRNLGRTGLSVSVLGFGASPLGNEFGPIDEAEGTRTVRAALDSGINFFDTAPYYGRGLSEQRLGVALDGIRSRVVLATKCARFGIDKFDFSAASAYRSIDDSLTRLRTDYVDILHVHDIEFGDSRQIVRETLPALRNIQRSGKARFIGVTGLALKMLQQVATEFPVDCILSYCRYNLLNQDLTDNLASFSRKHGIGLINASPLSMGLLSESGAPPWHPAPVAVKTAANDIVELCRRRGADVSSVALQFASSHPEVASTLSGMFTCAQVQANVASLEEEPDPDLLRDIDYITRAIRGMIWITGKAENH